MERGLGKREIVKGPERHRIGWCVRVNSAQQQPGQQREQQQHPEGTRQELHGSALAARGDGLRAAELVDMRWDQIEFRTANLHIRRVKQGTPSTHPILGDELRALRRLQREQESQVAVRIHVRASMAMPACAMAKSGHGTLMVVMVTSGFMAASSIDQVTSEITIARVIERHTQIGFETCL